MLGEKMAHSDLDRRLKGICVSSQNPVQRSFAHSNVRSNAMFFCLALILAAWMSVIQGFVQCFSFCRCAISRAFSGFLVRHSAATLAQYPGLALYAALRATFARCLAFSSRQLPCELCQSMACFCVQKRVRLPVIGAWQTMQNFWIISMPVLYAKNAPLASAKGAF